MLLAPGRVGRVGLTQREAVPIPPTGFVFLVEVENGITYYLVDNDGNYYVEPI